MSIGIQLFCIWFVAAIAFIIWRMLHSSITRINTAVMDGDIEAVRLSLDNGSADY